MKQRFVLCSFSVLLLLTASLCARGDLILGVYGGVDGWITSADGKFSAGGAKQKFSFDDETVGSFYLSLEHPIPLVPNLKLRHMPLKLSGKTNLSIAFEFDGKSFNANTTTKTSIDLTHSDVIVYYEILDNDLVSIDFGFNVKYFDGSVSVSGTTSRSNNDTQKLNYTGIVPLGYVYAHVGLPFTGFFAYAEGNLLSLKSNDVFDYKAGIAWEFVDNAIVDIQVMLGYRTMGIKFNDMNELSTNFTVSGPFAGIQVHF